MARWSAALVIVFAFSVCAVAGAAREAAQKTTCTVSGASTWTPPINVSNIRPTAVSFASTLRCNGGGVAVGAMAGFLRSPKLACVAPPSTTPESGVLNISWNTGASSRISLKVISVNSTGRQSLSGKVAAGLFKGDAVKLTIQADAAGQVGQCSNASPLVSNTHKGSITL